MLPVFLSGKSGGKLPKRILRASLFQLSAIEKSRGEKAFVDVSSAYTGWLNPALMVTGQDHVMSNPFMARAIQLSIENVRSGRGGPFGAVVVRGSDIIAEGENQVTVTNDPTAHAEVIAIRQACQKLGLFELKDCDLYTSCEPCPMCLGAIYWSRLSRVYFGSLAADASHAGFDDSFIYREIGQEHPARGIPMIQMMREEALEAFRAWQDKPDKTRY